MASRLARALALAAALTWGFDLFAYGREQRISGFTMWDMCNAQMLHMREQHQDWRVRDCDLDLNLTKPPTVVVPSPRPNRDKGDTR